MYRNWPKKPNQIFMLLRRTMWDIIIKQKVFKPKQFNFGEDAVKYNNWFKGRARLSSLVDIIAASSAMLLARQCPHGLRTGNAIILFHLCCPRLLRSSTCPVRPFTYAYHLFLLNTRLFRKFDCSFVQPRSCWTNNANLISWLKTIYVILRRISNTTHLSRHFN